jgi:hypothetical protein
MSQDARANCPIDALNWYVNHTLSSEEMVSVETHLTTCVYCRQDVELLVATRSAFERSAALTPLPRPDLFVSIEARLGKPQPSRLMRVGEHVAFLCQLVRAQIPLIRRDIWPSSTVVLVVGWIISFLLSAQQKTPSGAVLAVVAPLIAALGLSVIYGGDSDAGLELAMTSPTSPQQILLARFVLVFGYNLITLLILSLAFKLVLPAVELNALLELWLGPMFFLSTMALMLSLAIGTQAAVIGSLVVWMIRVLAFSNLDLRLNTAFLQAVSGFWSSTPMLVGLAVLFLAAGLIIVKREEHFL